MREVVLRTEQLTKRYRSFTALDHVDMTVCREDIYGLIGKNGAGKTTMMKVVTGLTEQSEGTFEMFGKSGSEIGMERRRIGCLIENPAFFGNMTAYQNLKYYCYQKGITDYSQIDEVLELVKLSDVKDKKFRKYSLGMKQRLGIAFAILDNPDLVILDEPINGLDPIGISELRDIFRRLSSERGITLVISSHILSELYAVANRFLFIDKGRVLKEITKQELDIECSRCLVINSDDIKRAAAILEQEKGITDYKVIDSTEMRVYHKNVNANELNRLLVQNDINISGIYESGVSIEDYFKQLVGEKQAEGKGRQEVRS